MNRRVSVLLFLLLMVSSAAFATLATPATISSVSCSAGNCTVTTQSAHNVASSDPGFCIINSSVSADNLCGAAVSVGSSTAFTVSSATMANCASSCGTAQPAPVFMLQSSTPQFGQQNVTACMWVFVTTGISQSGKTSSCAAQLSGSLQTALNAGVQNGTLVEYVVSAGFSNSATIPTIEQYFQALQFSYQLQAIAPGGVSGHECDVTGCN